MNDNGTMATGDAGRRALLKKLGLAAGAVAWATPAVQTIATAVAGAQDKTGDSGCYDISHLDLIIMRDGQGPYGIQWDPVSGWSKHSTSSKHCLAGYKWSQPPSSVLSGFPTPVAKAGGSYELTLPAGVTIVQSGGNPLAWSKAGQQCQRTTLVSGSTYRFDKWCSGTTTTSTTSTSTTTTTRPTTTSTTAPTTTTTVSGDDCDDEDKAQAQAYQVNYGSTATTRQGDLKTGCLDISHLDLIVMRNGQGPYGIQWDPGSGWSKHSTSSKHCLAGSTWTQPPSWVLSGLPTPVAKSGGAYEVTLPAGVTIVQSSGNLLAWSKAGTKCQRVTLVSGTTYRFDKWCSSTTTTTTRPPTTTTTASGGGNGDDCGSPGPGKDISHMDWILSRPGTDRYGIQYDFGGGWGAHPSTNTSSKHCLAGLSWRVPPGTWSFSGFGNAVSLGGGAFRITLPADVTVHDAFSKCGQLCRRATHLGGNTWRFDPC